MAKGEFNRKNITLTLVYITQVQVRQILYLEHFIVWLRYTDTKKIGGKEFGEPQTLLLEENREGKVVRESN